MQSCQVLDSMFVDKNTFVSLSPNHLCQWNVHNSECVMTFPAVACHPPFTCLSWKLDTSQNHKKQKSNKKKSEKLKAVQRYAIGTSTGDILLINGAGKELLKFNGGHSEQVNCITLTSKDLFYSCSNDRHIVEWDITETTHKWKWKADKNALTSISIGPHSKTLISAGKFIKIWNLKSKKLIWKFSSLKSPVYSLSLLNISEHSSSKGKSSFESLDGLCILSASNNESVIKVWRMDTLKQQKDAAFSFTLPTPARHYQVAPSRTCSKPTKLVVITDDEQVLLFSHVPNGGKKKPNDPIKTIRLSTETVVPLKILSARLKKTKKSNIITVAYECCSSVNFQTIDLDFYKEKDITVHCNPTTLKEKNSRKRADVNSPDKNFSKKKMKKSERNLLSLEERTGSAEKNKERLEEPTMTSGSTATFSQLCEKLSEDFKGNSSEYLQYVRWIKEAAEKHSSRLETISGDSPVWCRLQQLVGLRHQFDTALPRLQGTLDLLTSQIVQRQLGKVDQDALQVYEEESSDEMEYMPYDISDAIEESDDIRLDTSEESDSVSESSFENGEHKEIEQAS